VLPGWCRRLWRLQLHYWLHILLLLLQLLVVPLLCQGMQRLVCLAL
jgi:hypothetical protein